MRAQRRVPKTSRKPVGGLAQQVAARVRRSAPAGAARTPSAISSAETPKVAALSSSAQPRVDRGERRAGQVAGDLGGLAAVALQRQPDDVPVAGRGSAAAAAERAASNGGLSSAVTKQQRRASPAIGRPGMRDERHQHHPDQVADDHDRRYGYRSASAASTGPPSSHGR